MLPCLCEIERWGEGRQKESEETGFNLMTRFIVPEKKKQKQTKKNIKDFPGDPVVETSPSCAGGEGLIPGQGAKIPCASRPKKTKHKTEAVL